MSTSHQGDPAIGEPARLTELNKGARVLRRNHAMEETVEKLPNGLFFHRQLGDVCEILYPATVVNEMYEVHARRLAAEKSAHLGAIDALEAAGAVIDRLEAERETFKQDMERLREVYLQEKAAVHALGKEARARKRTRRRPP